MTFWIKKSNALWIKDNMEEFKKLLFYYFDFIGMGITHWKIVIVNEPEHIIKVTLVKPYHQKQWFVINLSNGNDIHVNGYIFPNQEEKFGTYFQNLSPLWEKTQNSLQKEHFGDQYLNDLFFWLERDKKIDSLLDI